MLSDILVRKMAWFQHGARLAGIAVSLYLLGWLVGRWTGNPELLLTVAVSFCGLYWALNRWVWKIKDNNTPMWLSNTAGSFWVLLFIWGFRSFAWEPFFVPSGSMNPNLQEGDVLLVEKYASGLRVPVIGTTIAPTPVSAGDVVVFLFPQDRSVHFVKRVVGLPGDALSFAQQQVWVNDKPLIKIPFASLKKEDSNKPFKFGTSSMTAGKQIFFEQASSGKLYLTQYNPQTEMPKELPLELYSFCRQEEGRTNCKIPEGHVFVMGDHRDNSLDSRFWGLVPIHDIKGRAQHIAFNTRQWTPHQWFQSLD